MKRARTDLANPVGQAACATSSGVTGPQRLETNAAKETIVVNSPYGKERTSYGWGGGMASFFSTNKSSSMRAVVPHHPNIHIGISSLNAVPGKKDRTMKTLMETYRTKFNCLEHCYPYHKVGEYEAWLEWAAMAGKITTPPVELDGAKVFGGVAPDRFLYTIKANSFLTHTRRLLMDVDVGAHVDTFFTGRCQALDPFLGPILVQLPPSFERTEAHMKRLADLYARLPKDEVQMCECEATSSSSTPTDVRRPRIRIAVEFRHRSWNHPEVHALLRQFGWALVVAHHDDDTSFATLVDTGASFMYVRLHDPLGRNVGDYGPIMMRLWAERVVRWLRSSDESAGGVPQHREVFFFLNNNDSHVGGLDEFRCGCHLPCPLTHRDAGNNGSNTRLGVSCRWGV